MLKILDMGMLCFLQEPCAPKDMGLASMASILATEKESP
jgi:hypothetical protein